MKLIYYIPYKIDMKPHKNVPKIIGKEVHRDKLAGSERFTYRTTRKIICRKFVYCVVILVS